MKKTMLGVMALLLVTAGCTQKRPFKAVAKNVEGLAEKPKTVIDVNSDYLYVPATVESDRRASAARPHWMGDAKRVRFVFGEKSL